MSLAAGARLGVYDVTAQIGAGGMGEVYRATDTNLKRQVAIKVLPESVAGDVERLARFRREAEVLAQLNHPNIAHIYGLERLRPHRAGDVEIRGEMSASVRAGGGTPAPGEDDAVTALVMELVEGEDLAQRLERGAIPVDEALAIAKQIAEALKAAHEQGIIHRDLKPANIKVRPDGTVKVLDFGLAKAIEGAHGSGPTAHGNPANSPTITSPALTQLGIILGTAAYMSPEQARGQAVDRRTDIWAFGCVLYEMLTGCRAFDGSNVADTLAGVLGTEPDWGALPSSGPPLVRSLLRRCLRKEPAGRIADVSTIIFALDSAAESAATSEGLSRVGARREAEERIASTRREVERTGRRRTMVVGVAALATGGVIAGVLGAYFTPAVAPPRVFRMVVPTDGPTAMQLANMRGFAIAPDGSRIVYRSRSGLVVRRLDELAPAVLAGQANPTYPFFSPDGQWVGFFDGSDNLTLKKVPVAGGQPVTVTRTDRSAIRGAAWGPDDTIVFATSSPQTGLYRVAAAGGEASAVSTPRAGEEADHFWPEFLPDGHTVLFTIVPLSGEPEERAIALLDLRSGKTTRLLPGATHARYVPTGHLVYGAKGRLWAVAFDVQRLATSGGAVPVLDDVGMTNAGDVQLDTSSDGMLVHVPGSASGGTVAAERLLTWADRDGREAPIDAPPRAYQSPRLSADGSQIVVSSNDQEQDLWAWDLRRQTLTRLTFEPGTDTNPLWSADGRRLVFSSVRDGQQNLYTRAADGTGPTSQLSAQGNLVATGVTPDGSGVIVQELVDGQHNVGLLRPNSSGRTEPLVASRFDELGGVVSPDGRWLAYQSNASGRFEIYVRPFPAADGGQWQVSTAGGVQPLWARGGLELFFVGPDGAIMATPVGTEPDTWNAGQPNQILKPGYYVGSGPILGRQYDVSPDGQRFLMIRWGDPQARAAGPSLIVVLNWYEELRRRLSRN